MASFKNSAKNFSPKIRPQVLVINECCDHEYIWLCRMSMKKSFLLRHFLNQLTEKCKKSRKTFLLFCSTHYSFGSTCQFLCHPWQSNWIQCNRYISVARERYLYVNLCKTWVGENEIVTDGACNMRSRSRFSVINWLGNGVKS